MCSRCLPTADLLSVKRVDVSLHCHFCSTEAETISHIFLDCEVAKRCWEGTGINTLWSDGNNNPNKVGAIYERQDEENRCLFTMICWSIWGARNAKLWDNTSTSPRVIVEGAKTFLYNWRDAMKEIKNQTQYSADLQVRWKKPPVGWVKLNVDATFNRETKSMGLGCVLRDAEGNFVSARSLQWKGLFLVKEAEALGIRDALSWVKGMGFEAIVVEMDAL